MAQNAYDSGVSVWSPQGTVMQVEYAMQSVNLSPLTIGLKNTSHAVLVSVFPGRAELCPYQRKVLLVDKHVGMSYAGYTADATLLWTFLRTECIKSKFLENKPLPLNRLMIALGQKMQVSTQRQDLRPYGVGLLVAGYDERGPHIYKIEPSGNFFNCKAMSIGCRSHAARSYLKQNVLSKVFKSSKEELICYGINAMSTSLSDDEESAALLKNISIGIVGKNQRFQVLTNSDVHRYLDMAKRLLTPTVPRTDPPECPPDCQ